MPVMTRILLLCLALFVGGGGAAARAERQVKVIASFSILGDMITNVGGARVQVTTLVGPNGDAHVFEPTPADAKAVSAADLVIVNGLGLEGWMDRLIKTSGYRGPFRIDPCPSLFPMEQEATRIYKLEPWRQLPKRNWGYP